MPRDGYYRHLPAMPPLVTRTAASARFDLYGAAGSTFVDHDPTDGIDDARARRLHEIARRFAPVLRRNNFSVPRFFDEVLGRRPVLHLDTWRRGRHVRSDSVLLYVPSLGGGPASDREADRDLAHSDRLLEAYLLDHHPSRNASRTEAAEGEDDVVSFFDFPGEDEASWREAYENGGEEGAYAHFFIHEDPTLSSGARYSLVVQYWFFYPFNDSGNNHEGDWEHLSVLLTTEARAGVDGPERGLLRGSDIRRILDARSRAADSLVIRAVEYYFHESVVVLDYLAGARPGSTWERLKKLQVWEQPDYIANSVFERQRQREVLASHPIGYIGGNNKGPDELVKLWPRFQASYNRNSHGTYPFPGTWQSVGSLGATERLAGATVPRLREESVLLPDGTWSDAGFEDDHFIWFDSAEIRLLPDWEQLAVAVLERPDVRREWSWLLLPIRWGYPATASPGGGAIEHVDLGQIAPEGPAFQPTWNRLASESGFRLYRPRVMRGLFVPMTPWDRLNSGWGILNVPIALVGFIPGWSVALTQLSPWLMEPLEALGADPPRTFAPEFRTRRFSSTAIGWHWQHGGQRFARLLQEAHAEMGAESSEGAGAFSRMGRLTRETDPALRVSLSLHYGPRFTVQNAFTRSTVLLSCTAFDAAGDPAGMAHGTLTLKELTGGFQYTLAAMPSGRATLFGGAGWGWTWYQIDEMLIDGQATGFRRTGGYAVSILPSARWWPNTWYDMVGVEIEAPRDLRFFEGLGYGLEIRYTGLIHRLGATRPGRGGSLGWVTRRELALSAVVSW